MVSQSSRTVGCTGVRVGGVGCTGVRIGFTGVRVGCTGVRVGCTGVSCRLHWKITLGLGKGSG